MEVETAVRRYLLDQAPVTGYVQAKVFKFRLEESIEGTSGLAIVVARNNGWATPDPITTQEYPILSVKCYADPTRFDDGEIRTLDAPDKAAALYRTVNQFLHAKRGVRWGARGSDEGLFVVTSQRWREPTLVTQKDLYGHAANDPLGDVVYVHAEYALQVIH